MHGLPFNTLLSSNHVLLCNSIITLYNTILILANDIFFLRTKYLESFSNYFDASTTNG